MSASEPINVVETGVFTDFRVSTRMSMVSVREMLTNQLAGYESLNEEDYTEESWEPFEVEVNTAEAILDNDNATIRDIYTQSLKAQYMWSQLVLREDVPVEPVDKTALQDAIQSANALDEGDYTPNSWVALDSAVQAGNVTNGDPDATQTQVDNATNAITTAINNLVPRADKSALQAALQAANALDGADYTPETWSTLESAVQAGETVNDDPDATQTQVDNATNAIVTAINNLVPRADKSALQAALQAANALDEADYTPETWGTLESAVQAGNTVNDDLDATQAEVDNAVTSIQSAIDGLEEVVDKTALQSAIQAAEALNEEDYTPASWGVLSNAVQAGEAMMVDPNITQIDIDNAVTEINNGIGGLVPRADKSALQTALQAAGALNEEDYTPETWSLLTAAVQAGNTVNNNLNATQTEVDNAVTDINDAISNLEEVAEEEGGEE